MPYLHRYDKLLIDEEIFIYNEVERRIERLPFTISGQTISAGSVNSGKTDDEVVFPEDAPSAKVMT